MELRYAFLPLSAFAIAAACTFSGGVAPQGTGGAGATGGAGGAGGSTVTINPVDAGDAGDAGGGGPTAFVYGLNLGYYNAQLTDTDESQLGMAAGTDSHRHKLTEVFLDQWGDTVHVPELQAMIKAGEHDIVCNLTGPAAANSNAPPGGNTEQYSPMNLWQDVFLTSGDVNPANTWAAFVARVVNTYSPYIHTWEVWNEPDQVGNNTSVVTDWGANPPNPLDLIWWNDTIFAYIRLLRVTYEVVHQLDPQGKVTLGGIGYPTFLDAILRYTDEPSAGAVDGAHPFKGSAYFDVVSYHYYPIFSPGNSDVGAKGLVTLHDQLEGELARYSVTGKTFIITETGAPRFSLGGDPGGTAYAQNYLMKAMALAQNAGVSRIDWFILGDSADPGASPDPYSYMGLYLNLTNVTDPSAAMITQTGTAYATIGHLLAGSLSDPVATAALSFPAGTNGVALTTSDQKHAYVVWAEPMTGENGTGTVTLPAGGAATVYAWDYSKTMTTSMATPSGGMVQVSVTSSPVVVIAP